MTGYAFFENQFIGDDGQNLFQSPTFFRLHSGLGDVYFEFCWDGKPRACIHFSKTDDLGGWRSPARGTFSGLTFSREIAYEDLFHFFRRVELSLRSRGAKSLEILPAPQAHSEVAFAKQVYVLKECGYEIAQVDLNHSLRIDSRALSDRMSYGNLKRLRKCLKAGFAARELSIDHLPLVYETIAINRASKGYPLSMTLPQLQQMAVAFPSSVILFGCMDGHKFAAAAVCLRLSSQVLYVFYWGNRPEYSAYSPVVAVAETVYAYAQMEGYQILDVGASTVGGVPNLGLINFKGGLGFEESLKIRMRKSL